MSKIGTETDSFSTILNSSLLYPNKKRIVQSFCALAPHNLFWTANYDAGHDHSLPAIHFEESIARPIFWFSSEMEQKGRLLKLHLEAYA